jgi:hypothetical protein
MMNMVKFEIQCLKFNGQYNADEGYFIDSLYIINKDFRLTDVPRYKRTEIDYEEYQNEQKCNAVINLANLIQENNGSELLSRLFTENNKWYKIIKCGLCYSWNKIIKKFTTNRDIKLSSAMSEIFQKNDIRKYIHNILDEQFVVCITYHNGLDTQLGVTEGFKVGEMSNPYLAAQRGIWEETGVFLEENVFNYLNTFNSVTCFSVDINNIENNDCLPPNNVFNFIESKKNNKVFVLLHGNYNNINELLINSHQNNIYYKINNFYQQLHNIDKSIRKKKIDAITYEYNTSEITIINKKIFEFLSLSFYSN